MLLTSGTSSWVVFSKISQSTSTGVLGLMAMPAFNPRLWIYLISSFGLVFLSEVADGVSASVELIAAS
jgi:hypothetical protein